MSRPSTRSSAFSLWMRSTSRPSRSHTERPPSAGRPWARAFTASAALPPAGASTSLTSQPVAPRIAPATSVAAAMRRSEKPAARMAVSSPWPESTPRPISAPIMATMGMSRASPDGSCSRVTSSNWATPKPPLPVSSASVTRLMKLWMASIASATTAVVPRTWRTMCRVSRRGMRTRVLAGPRMIAHAGAHREPRLCPGVPARLKLECCGDLSPPAPFSRQTPDFFRGPR